MHNLQEFDVFTTNEGERLTVDYRPFDMEGYVVKEHGRFIPFDDIILAEEEESREELALAV